MPRGSRPRATTTLHPARTRIATSSPNASGWSTSGASSSSAILDFPRHCFPRAGRAPRPQITSAPRRADSSPARTNQTGDVAHLAAGARLALAVKVEMGGRVGEDVAPARHILSDQILHRDFGDNQIGGAERQAADRANVILELGGKRARSEEHTSELQSLMRISYAVFCLKKKKY